MRRAAFRFAMLSVVACAFVAACGWDPSHPFEREAPQVKEAIKEYDGGDAASAADILEDYLLTGECKEGTMATPNRLVERPNGTFDLGLVLFKIGEAYGRRFGEEEEVDGGANDPNVKALRGALVECALKILRRMSEDSSQAVSLRARARYLEGNLLFLSGDYENAVSAYDKALELAPGMGDAGPLGVPDGSQAAFVVDPVGRDAAWNRAIALRRIQEKKDAGPPDGGGDGGGDAGGDSGGDGGGDSGSGEAGSDAGGDSGGGGDAGKDSGGNNDDNKDGGRDAGSDSSDDKNDNKDSKNQPDAGQAPPPSRQSQDERILDQLENAPTVQQEAARKQASKHPRVGPGMTDK